MNDPNSYPRPRTERLPPKDQLIMGLHAVEEVLLMAPERLIQVYTTAGEGADKRKQEVLNECAKKRVPVQKVPFDLLTKMAGSDSHQSFAAHVKGRRYFDVPEFLLEMENREKVFVLALSLIFDPQNFGAILRAAECFGVDGVAWSKNRGCDLTPLVTKASSGASELMRLIRISNLADGVDKWQKAGYEVVATVADANAAALSEFAFAPKTVLIMGSEGEGIQPLLIEKADKFLTIPMKGKIKSLNVSQASAVILFTAMCCGAGKAGS